VELVRKPYAPFYCVPRSKAENSPVIFDYDDYRRNENRMSAYAKVRLTEDVASALAELSPYPNGVYVGLMKQVANTRTITLRQMSILLSWAAQRAQQTGRAR
jgi:hypothetical protein